MRSVHKTIDRARSATLPPVFAQPDAARLLATFHANAAGRSVAIAGVTPDSPVIGHELDTVRPAASTIKIALFAALLWAQQQGKIDLNQPVKISALTESKWPSVLEALDPSLSLRLIDICAFAVTTSDNAAADIMHKMLDPALLAQWLRETGCSSNTVMPVGYSDSAIETGLRRNTTTLRDMVMILRHVAADALYEPLMLAMFNNVRNSRIPRLLPDEVWVAHKTGSMNGVVNDVGIVCAPKAIFIMGVLSDQQNDKDATETAIAHLAADLLALAEK